MYKYRGIFITKKEMIKIPKEIKKYVENENSNVSVGK
jgi:hypothetical protein